MPGPHTRLRKYIAQLAKNGIINKFKITSQKRRVVTDKKHLAAIRAAWDNCGLFMSELFVGGDLEHVESPLGAFRGPITGIELTHTHLIIDVDWVAHIPVSFPHQFPQGPPKLVEGAATTYRYEREHLGNPNHIGSHRMHFSYQTDTRVTLFPAGGSKMARPTSTITTEEITAKAAQHKG